MQFSRKTRKSQKQSFFAGRKASYSSNIVSSVCCPVFTVSTFQVVSSVFCESESEYEYGDIEVPSSRNKDWTVKVIISNVVVE